MINSNTIVIGLDDLSKQQDDITESNLSEDTKEGLGNLISTIQDMAEDFGIRDKLKFALVIENE